MLKQSKIIFVTTILSSFFNLSFGQVSGENTGTLENAARYVKTMQFDAAIHISQKYIDNKDSLFLAYLIMGQALSGEEKFKDALDYLEKVKNITDAPDYSKAWAMKELGICYFLLGDREKSKRNIFDCINLNATRNSTLAAKALLYVFGCDTLYSPWATRESKHFIFHFQDTALTTMNSYVQTHELAFDSINNFFRHTLPKKIDFFVWKDTVQATSIFRRELAFSQTYCYVTHTTLENSVGHEITHQLSAYAREPKMQNRLISEGVCVCFDLSHRDNLASLKNVITEKHLTISVRDEWKNPLRYDEIVYPLGGELVKRLIEKFGRDKFMMLLENESLENAEKIYGSELDPLLDNLQNDIQQQ